MGSQQKPCQKRAGINNSVYSKSWLLLTAHFGPVFIVPSQWSISAVIRVQPICGHENRLEQRQRLNLGQFISLLLIMSASWVYSRRTTGFCCHPTNMALIITTSTTTTIIIIIITIIITIIIIIIVINNTIGSCFNPGKR